MDIITTYDLPTAVASVIRIVAIVFMFFMAASALHGHELKRHTGGNHDRHATAHGVFKEGLIGVIVSLTVAMAAPPLIQAAFSLTNLA